MNPEEIAPAPADFFIIYTETDRAWAEWIAWCLEEAGYSVILQAWDFRPGHNFVLMMNMAVRAHHTVAVLSPAFLEAAFVQPEWAAALRQDPTSVGRKIIPVRVEDCQPEKSLLAQIVYIDLVKCPRDTARSILLAGVRGGRAKPQNEPPCPKWTNQDYRVGQTPRWSIDEARRFFDAQAADLSVTGATLKAFVDVALH